MCVGFFLTALLWQNRAERQGFLSKLEASKGFWIKCDSIEENEKCWTCVRHAAGDADFVPHGEMTYPSIDGCFAFILQPFLFYILTTLQYILWYVWGRTNHKYIN